MSGDDPAALVDQLRRDRRRHPYEGRREYAQAARRLADVCARLIAAGDAAQAVPVLRKAIDRITRALMCMDDSSGAIGGDLRAMMALYARACAAAPPKPAALATWLVTLASSDVGWPRVLLRDFAEGLGERGLAEVARLVETLVPESFAARDLREQLAEVSGDVDAYVAVLAEHLYGAGQYVRIAGALRDADRGPEAILWARRRLSDRPGGLGTELLRDTLVDLLLTSGLADEAVRVRRDEFERRPTAAAYRALAATGADDPAPWALPILEEHVAQQPAELIETLLFLGRDDDAWRAGREHRSSLGRQLWLTLLERRRAGHPADVIGPYEELVEQHLAKVTDKYRYRKAVALLPTLREVHTEVGTPSAFPTYLTTLRARHARKTAFLTLLDAAGM